MVSNKMKNLKYAVALVLGILLVWFLYTKMYSRGENDDDGMVFYFAPSCPHCRDTKPEWDKFVKHHENDDSKKKGKKGKKSKKKMPLILVNAEKNPELAKDVNAFPTFVLKKNGKVHKKEGAMKFEDMMEFEKTGK